MPDSETWSDSEGPICPYCGYLNKACESDCILYNESTESYDCDECGKEFGVSLFISHSWSATRQEKQDG